VLQQFLQIENEEDTHESQIHILQAYYSSQSNNNQPVNATTKNKPFAYVISWKSKANQPKKK